MKKDLDQYFNEFLFEAEYVKKVRPETLRGYKNSYDLLKKILPDISLYHISASSISNFFKILQERKRVVGKGTIKSGIKKSTAATYWCKLNVFFVWLVNKGHLKENPFKGLKYPKPNYADRKYLEKEDIERIIGAIHNNNNSKNILLFKRNLVLFYLLLFCGLRKEEVIHLQLRDIDFEKKIITIRGESSKSGKTRQIPLHSLTGMHLKDYLRERKRYITPYVIVSSSRDDKLSYDGLKHLVRKIQKYSGIKFHLHQFRHTFAVNFLKKTNNIFKLKLLLGHEDLRVTMLYLRCLPIEELHGDIDTLSIDTFI